MERLPDHLAVIQDGNRRYARERGEDPRKGHEYGAETTEDFLDWCLDAGIPEVTLYTFSTENFERTDRELRSLFDLIADKLRDLGDDDQIHDERVRVEGVGEIERLPPRVVEALEYVEDRTEDYDRLRLNVALAYGGREELLNAAREVLEEVRAGDLSPEEVTEEAVERHLYVDDVDLVIRTGGERRTSNFLPWQAWGGEAVVEFLGCYWPEFRRADLENALESYGRYEAGGSADPSEIKVEGPAD